MNVTSYTIEGAEGRPIPIDVTSPETGSKGRLIIFVHGFKGFKDWGTHSLTAEYFAAQGFDFLKFNFSHAGISANSNNGMFDDLNAFSLNTFSKELFDLDQVITFASSGKSFPSPDHIFVIGHSLGGAISIIQTAEDKRIDKLVTWASVSNLRNLWSNEQEEAWRKNGTLYIHNTRTDQQMPLSIEILEDLNHHSERLDVLNAARSVEKPWLIIHGDSDTSIATEQAQELNRQQELARILLIEGGDHVFGGRHPWSEKELPGKLKMACDATIDFLKG